jgi:hypothetical protein
MFGDMNNSNLSEDERKLLESMMQLHRPHIARPSHLALNPYTRTGGDSVGSADTANTLTSIRGLTKEEKLWKQQQALAAELERIASEQHANEQMRERLQREAFENYWFCLGSEDEVIADNLSDDSHSPHRNNTKSASAISTGGTGSGGVLAGYNTESDSSLQGSLGQRGYGGNISISSFDMSLNDVLSDDGEGSVGSPSPARARATAATATAVTELVGKKKHPGSSQGSSVAEGDNNKKRRVMQSIPMISLVFF